MGLQKEIIAVCDLCSKKERFEEAHNYSTARQVALNRGWYLKKKGTQVDYVICDRCRTEIGVG